MLAIIYSKWRCVKIKLFRYRKPSAKTVLGVTKAKKTIRRKTGVTAATKPTRAYSNAKRQAKRKAGYYSGPAKMARAGKAPTPLGCLMPAIVIAMFLASILLMGCTGAVGKPNQSSHTVTGTIYNQSRYPNMAIVKLGDREMQTKLDGIFQFDNVPTGNHEFTVTPLYYWEPSPYLEHHKSTLFVNEDVVSDLRLNFVISDDLGEGYDYWTYNLVNGSGYYARISASLTGKEINLAPGQSVRIMLYPGEYSFMYSTGAGYREGKIWAYRPNVSGEITRERIYTK